MWWERINSRHMIGIENREEHDCESLIMVNTSSTCVSINQAFPLSW